MVEERLFLEAILRRPDDDAMKLVYADWLEEHGDPRAEYLRLMISIRHDRPVTPELQKKHGELSSELAELRTKQVQGWMNKAKSGHSIGEDTELAQHINDLEKELADLSDKLRRTIPTRLQELASRLDTTWLALVSDPEIEGCGRSTGDSWRLRFDFVCDRSWSDMRPTEVTNVRHCATCDKNVYYCDNLADAREHSSAERCIAVDIGVIRRDGDLIPKLLFMGRPSPQELRETYERDVDPVSRARLDRPSKQGVQEIRKVETVSEADLAPTKRAKKITQIAR